MKKEIIINTKNQLLQFNLSELKRSGNPNSLEIENHISWDFAEAVNLSHSSQQEVINLYYLDPFFSSHRGKYLFLEFAKKLFLNSENVGKGADAVISLVHHYFENFGLGEKNVIIHADNCSGQNKNNAMIQYLVWRVISGLHNRIKYCFIVAGHTKFSPDGFFGLIKLKLRKSEVQNLSDLVHVIHDSTFGGITNSTTTSF
ncbi:hypothetical protein RhiirC2_801631 [Rhizophagus irregularis]|uniref:DUF7869 domain-containing protein n=1 Tax=Rhizophagus irregularis TaxID=588596 RepID=A0A2N1M255_9GLOM|nr:hypothetical protein RhiirC2_801631 [Rhizophagus irregularis]